MDLLQLKGTLSQNIYFKDYEMRRIMEKSVTFSTFKNFSSKFKSSPSQLREMRSPVLLIFFISPCLEKKVLEYLGLKMKKIKIYILLYS